MHNVFTTPHHQANAFTCLFVKFDSPAFPMRAYSEVWDHRYRILASVTSLCALTTYMIRQWTLAAVVRLPNSSLLHIAQSPVQIPTPPIHQSLPIPHQSQSIPTNQTKTTITTATMYRVAATASRTARTTNTRFFSSVQPLRKSVVDSAKEVPSVLGCSSF